MEILPTETTNRKLSEVDVDEDILELVPGFCQSRKKDLKSIGEFLDASDFVAIAKVSHTIKGVARPYGFPTLEAHAVSLEKAAKLSDKEQCSAVLKSMTTYFKAYSS